MSTNKVVVIIIVVLVVVLCNWKVLKLATVTSSSSSIYLVKQVTKLAANKVYFYGTMERQLHFAIRLLDTLRVLSSYL